MNHHDQSPKPETTELLLTANSKRTTEAMRRAAGGLVGVTVEVLPNGSDAEKDATKSAVEAQAKAFREADPSVSWSYAHDRVADAKDALNAGGSVVRYESSGVDNKLYADRLADLTIGAEESQYYEDIEHPAEKLQTASQEANMEANSQSRFLRDLKENAMGGDPENADIKQAEADLGNAVNMRDDTNAAMHAVDTLLYKKPSADEAKEESES